MAAFNLKWSNMCSQMNYKKIDEYLEYVDTFGIVPGLDNMNSLVEALNNPLEGIKVIHVAGTNGKGSVSTMIAHVLAKGKINVGIYNSPALVNAWEIIRFNNNSKLNSITKEEYYGYMETVVECAKELNSRKIYPTRFEIETMAAFVAFRDRECEIAIVETGMGGREDATNVIANPLITVLTSISMDHMAYLGNTIEEIVACKCGIFKENSTAVVANSNLVYQSLIDDFAKKMKCEIVYSDINKFDLISSKYDKLEFNYKDIEHLTINTGALCQIDNVMTAIDVIDVLKEKMGLEISIDDIREGLDSFMWKGRFQVVKNEPLVIVDGAHNIAAAKLLKDTVISIGLKDKLILLMAVYKDKDYEDILEIMSEVSDYIICSDVGNVRALKADSLAKSASKYYKVVEHNRDIVKAIQQGEKTAENYGKGLLCFGTLSMMKHFD